MKDTNSDKKIAMLIDGDNAQASLAQEIIGETSKYGRITIKRIYGDWSSPQMKNWQKELAVNAIKPIQDFAHTKGKNATDIALVIDAMDILHRDDIDTFCIVSSDSDFTGLVTRIRESGHRVIGIGRKQTPDAFIKACDIFTYTENFEKQTPESKDKTKKVNISFLRKAYNIVEQENGMAYLSQVSQTITKLAPNFDPRTYGFKNYTSLFKSLTKDFKLVIHEDGSTISVKDIKDLKS